MKSVKLKIGNMRKEREFCVMRGSGNAENGTLMIQSDVSIGEFDEVTGEGIFNPKGCYFIHLSPFLGAKPLTLTLGELAAVRAACTNSGDEIGPGVFMA